MHRARPPGGGGGGDLTGDAAAYFSPRWPGALVWGPGRSSGVPVLPAPSPGQPGPEPSGCRGVTLSGLLFLQINVLRNRINDNQKV